MVYQRCLYCRVTRPARLNDQTDDGGSEDDLHVVGHRTDIPGGETDKRRAHSDERPNQTEHGTDLRQELREGEIFLADILVAADDVVRIVLREAFTSEQVMR